MSTEAYEGQIKLKSFPKLGENKLVSTAYHEAGHALIDLVYGFKVQCVTIVANEKDGYIGAYYSRAATRTSNTIEYYTEEADLISERFGEAYRKVQGKHFISGLLAGFIAQAIYSGVHDFNGARSDFSKITDWFISEGETVIDNKYLQDRYDDAAYMLEANIDLLNKIAGDLYRSKELSADYFDSLPPLQYYQSM